MPLRRCKPLLFLFLWLPFLLTSCGDPGDFQEAYYPIVYEIEVSAGKGYIDVTINGLVRGIGDFISDVQVIKLRHEIILIPIAEFSPSEDRPTAMDPFQKRVHIEGLEQRNYTITVIGRAPHTEEKRVITEIVKVE